MVLQIAPLSEVLLANGTVVWFQASVNSHVVFEVSAQSERTLADRALMWLLAGVYREVVA